MPLRLRSHYFATKTLQWGKSTSLFIQNVEGFISIIFEIVNENQQPKGKEEMNSLSRG